MKHPIPMRLKRYCSSPARSGTALIVALLVTAGCDKRAAAPGNRLPQAIRLFNAASIARPLRILADSFTVRTGIAVSQENQSSLELARKLTEFGDVPDVLALADYRVFPTLLAPKFVTGWWLFARNRLVIGYTDKSRHHDLIGSREWRDLLTMPDVEVGRSDPNTDPSGYRTLMVFQLAEAHYGEPGLARRLLAAAPPRNVRPREADQIGMLQAGSLDYIWTYENLARGAGLQYVQLPDRINLGNASDSAFYAKASVRVAGKRRGDTVEFHGEPILYGVAVPIAAADTAHGYTFVQFMLSADGQRILRDAALDAIDTPIAVGAAAGRGRLP